MQNGQEHYRRFFFRYFYQPWTFSLVDEIAEASGRGFFLGVAGAFGLAYPWFHPEVVHTVQRNLELLLGRKVPESEARRVFHRFSECIADYSWMGRQKLEESASLCTEYSGIEGIEAALERGRGAVLATGHFSFFEYGALILTRRRLPVSILTLSEHNEELTDWRAQYRKRWGADTIELGADPLAPVAVVRKLQENQLCAMLVDRPALGFTQPYKLPGGYTPFSTSAALLAYLGDCPVIPVITTRLDNGNYRLVAKPPISVRDRGPREKAIREATEEIATSLFDEIRRAPTQWFQFVDVRSHLPENGAT